MEGQQVYLFDISNRDNRCYIVRENWNKKSATVGQVLGLSDWKRRTPFNESAEERNWLGICIDGVTSNPPCCFVLSFKVSCSILIVDIWQVMAHWLVRITQGCSWPGDACCEKSGFFLVGHPPLVVNMKVPLGLTSCQWCTAMSLHAWMVPVQCLTYHRASHLSPVLTQIVSKSGQTGMVSSANLSSSVVNLFQEVFSPVQEAFLKTEICCCWSKDTSVLLIQFLFDKLIHHLEVRTG